MNTEICKMYPTNYQKTSQINYNFVSSSVHNYYIKGVTLAATVEAVKLVCLFPGLQLVRNTGQENNCLKKENRSLNKQLQSCQEAEKIALGGFYIRINIP